MKDKKVILYRKEVVKDSEGFGTLKYIPIYEGRIWAYVRQLSASEFYSATAVQQKEDVLFALNFRSNINANCFVEYRGVIYDVTRVDTHEGYKRDLKVYALAMSSQPSKGDILEWQG